MKARGIEGNQMKILFLHGLESSPGGSKVRYLRSLGYEVINPLLPKHSWGDSLENAQTLIDSENPDIIIGSSRGGAVALNVRAESARLILIAPAWKRFGADRCEQLRGGIILHCREDDIVPYEDSVELSELTGAYLIPCGTNHRMSDPDALDGILDAVRYLGL